MRIFTDKQIDEILGRLLLLKKEFNKENWNNPIGEFVSRTLEEISDFIMQSDVINVEVTQK